MTSSRCYTFIIGENTTADKHKIVGVPKNNFVNVGPDVANHIEVDTTGITYYFDKRNTDSLILTPTRNN